MQLIKEESLIYLLCDRRMASLSLTRKKNVVYNLNRWTSHVPNFRLCKRGKAQSVNVSRFQRNCTLSQCQNKGFKIIRLPAVRYNSKSFHPKPPVRNIRYQELCSKVQPLTVHGRYFHTSQARKAAPILPIIGAALARFSGPIAKFIKLLAVLAGRCVNTIS